MSQASHLGELKDISLSPAEIEFKAGLLALVSEYFAERQCRLPAELAQAAIRSKPEKVVLVNES